ADHVKPLCEVFKDKAADSIIPLYLRLLTDAEVEVRTVAAARVADAAAVSPTKEFLETLMPALERLTAPREQSQHVRASLAGSVLQLCAIFGKQLTVDYLINIVLQLIRDECPEVRLQLISTLEHLSSTVGVDVLAQSLLPSIKELGKDRQWRVRLSIIKVMPDLAKYLGEPNGLMSLCRRRVLSQLPWTTAVVSAAVAIGLLVVHVTFGCVALAVWGYFFGYYVLRSQSSPYPLQIRASVAIALLVCTSVVTAAAWLFLGGSDGCRAFDPEMKTSFGYKFDQFWTLLCFRHAVNWFLTVIGVCLVLADHPQSTYIRDCIRCLLYLYTSQIVATLGNTWIACAGADENNDGVRDSFLEGSVNMQESLIAGLQVSGRLLLVLSGNWFLQIVVKMMRALEAAFEEPLPCFRAIVYLKYVVVALTILLPAAVRLELLFLLGCFTSALSLVVLTFLEFLALRAPLLALQRSLRSRTTLSGAPSGKMLFAASTLRRFQVAVLLSNSVSQWALTFFSFEVLGNSTIAFYVLITALTNGFVREYIALTTVDYSSLLNAVGLAIGLAILTGSLNVPKLGSPIP
ncbi:PP2AA2, partial [Symbiodinium sp. CCMP2456]